MSTSFLSIEDLDRDQLELRCKQLEIKNANAEKLCEDYQVLFDQVIGGHRISPAREGGERVQVVASSSRSIPDDQGRRRRQLARRGSSTLVATPPVQEPLEIVQDRNQENMEPFIGIIASLCGDNNPGNRSKIFGEAGLGNYQLAPREVPYAGQTPDIAWKIFASLFGGQVFSERPTGQKVTGYGRGSFLCPHYITQPFAPTRIGEPGVILSPPDAALVGDIFHVFFDPSPVERKTELLYCGLYAKVHGPISVQIDEWHSLPEQCRQKWVRILKWRKPRDFHARCMLRKRSKSLSDPSKSEARKWIRRYYRGDEVMDRELIQEAFDSGVEEFSFETISCVGYDTKLAEILKREVERRRFVP